MRALLAILLLGAAPVPDTVGVWGGWGAFRDASPRRCYAIARPVGGGGDAFASVADWPDRNIRRQLSIRLSREASPGTRVTLSMGERRFDLVAGDGGAWAADARTDRAIVAAMRSARSMSVEGVARGGGAFADTYVLAGAATAIDAATLACRE